MFVRFRKNFGSCFENVLLVTESWKNFGSMVWKCGDILMKQKVLKILENKNVQFCGKTKNLENCVEKLVLKCFGLKMNFEKKNELEGWKWFFQRNGVCEYFSRNYVSVSVFVRKKNRKKI